MVVDRLNRLSQTEKEGKEPPVPREEADLRQKIRRAMLRTLKDLPMRDQVSCVPFLPV